MESSGITQYLPNWIKNNFVSSTGQPVKNKDMIVHLLALLNQRGPTNGVRFVHVRAHRGEVGNEGADVGLHWFRVASFSGLNPVL
jgi:ribonuclease HI